MKMQSAKKINPYLILAMVLILLIKWTALPSRVPLFYSRPWGEDQLAPKIFLLLLPGISLIIFLINSGLAKTVFKKNHPIFADLGYLTSFVVAVLGLISLLKIIFLVS